MASVEAVPYEDITLANGKVTRRCIANDVCRTKNICYEKRIDMMDHLNDVHGIVHNIPFRKVGRPSGLVLATSSKPLSFEKQSRARFANAEYKFNRNMKKHEAKVQKAKIKEWNAMSNVEKEAKGPRDVFVNDAIMMEMEAYMSQKDDRMREIQRRIVEGYEKHVSCFSLLLSIMTKLWFSHNVVLYLEAASYPDNASSRSSSI